MIAHLIRWCVANRAMVLLLTACAILAGIWGAKHITIDAIPDLSDVQVIIRTDYAGQAPQVVEDQITYPLTTAMLAVPHAKVVRGSSMFGSSFVYIIFDDGTDIYWARSRVLEQLNAVSSRLPPDVTPQLGPDATGVGWVYQYVLTTGWYCPQHPKGLWHDPQADAWYASRDDADEAVRSRLTLHRLFADRSTCPIDGEPLAEPQQDLAQLRSLQDWYLRYELTAVEGVSEVAGVGGFVRQYQIVADPVRLRALNISMGDITRAVRRSNVDVGGRLIEQSETEFMVRGLGYLGSVTDDAIAEAREQGIGLDELRSRQVLGDLQRIALRANADGSPIYLADVAEVRLGPEIRRGIAEWNGQGEAVGGIVIMRFGENAKATIERVRERLDTLQAGLPNGVAIEVAYDRSDLIERAVATVRDTLLDEVLVVSLVILAFLLHARSAMVAAFVLPAGVLVTLAIMYALDINANIMSLGGIALSIGVMVDSSIVMVEDAHKHLERFKDKHGREPDASERVRVIADAAAEVGPTLFFSLLILTVSFLPIFILGEQSGRLFKPLAVTKTLAMASAAVLAVTIIPVLMVYLVRDRVLPGTWRRGTRWAVYVVAILGPAAGVWLANQQWSLNLPSWLPLAVAAGVALVLLPQRMFAEHRNPVSVLLQRVYDPAFRLCMKARWLTLLLAIVAVVTAWYPFSRLGSEFMPPLEEGDLLYMPTADPGISATKVTELLQQTDRLILQFPEVEHVFGKAGRADTATDPAPLPMFETTLQLHRDKSRWRTRPVERFYSGWPTWLQGVPRTFWPDVRAITTDELVYGYTLPVSGSDTPLHVPGLNDAVRVPGLTNAWTMPIRTRIDMLSTGIRTPVGVKVLGPDVRTLAQLSSQIENVVKTSQGTGKYTLSAFADRSVGGHYLDIRIDRDSIARHNMHIADVQETIASALGGMNVTRTVEGLERYPVNVRYPHELRDSVEAIREVLVSSPSGAMVPLGQVAIIEFSKGPPMIKSENGRLTSWVYIDIAGIDVGTYVNSAKAAVEREVKLPEGYSLDWSGQYEYMQAARQRLMVAIPLTAVVIIGLLYMATRSWLRVIIVLLAVPFSLVGAAWMLYVLDYNLSLAVWVGIIALAGLDAETGLVMLLYLDNSYERFAAEGRMRNAEDLWHAVHDGAVQRIRPKTMTVMTTFIGLLPLLWASGAGADTMRRLAAPMIGGLATSFAAELLLYPVLFYMAKKARLGGRS